jgi:hypothetical protein
MDLHHLPHGELAETFLVTAHLGTLVVLHDLLPEAKLVVGTKVTLPQLGHQRQKSEKIDSAWVEPISHFSKISHFSTAHTL